LTHGGRRGTRRHSEESRRVPLILGAHFELGSLPSPPDFASAFWRLAPSVREELADDLPHAIDPGEQEVIDEGHISPVTLLGDGGRGGVAGLVHRHDAGAVVPGVRRPLVGHVEELLDGDVVACSTEIPEHPGIGMEGLLELARIALRLAIGAQLEDLADGCSLDVQHTFDGAFTQA
jgi:hypothetical protein